MAEGRYLFAKFAGSIAGVLLCSLNLHAQAVGTVRGRVADTGTNQPLANVSIVVEGTRFGTTTRLDGTFDLGGVPAGRVSLGARRIGYHSTSTLVTVAAGAVASVDIESMTILKDASATAIYGSRAANGVILITTKRGTRDSQLEYDVYAGAASPTKTLGLATADQYRTFVTQFKDSLGGQGAVTALGNASTDWEKALTRTSLAMNHNLAFSGGSAQTKYRASMNYFDQEGIIKNSGLKRDQGRLKATHEALVSPLRLALHPSASRAEHTFSPNENGGGFTGGFVTNMVIFDATQPAQNADGKFLAIGTD